MSEEINGNPSNAQESLPSTPVDPTPAVTDYDKEISELKTQVESLNKQNQDTAIEQKKAQELADLRKTVEELKERAKSAPTSPVINTFQSSVPTVEKVDPTTISHKEIKDLFRKKNG